MQFLGQRELSRVSEARGRWIAAEVLQQEIYLLKLPAVRHGGHHLRQLFLLALQHTVHVLYWDLWIRKHGSGHKNGTSGHRQDQNNRDNVREHHVPVMFYSPVP